MTQNQISAQNVRELERHNRATEEQTQYMNTETAGHYRRQDIVNKEHYERSDKASIISANASAMNAETNRKNYNIQYDIEYGWTGDGSEEFFITDADGKTKRYIATFPEGMPLTAQQKSTDLIKSIIAFPLEAQKTVSETVKNRSQATKNATSAVNDLFSAIFGKAGAVKAVSDIIISEGD